MKASFFLLCFFLLAPAAPATAEYLQGTLVHIDRDRGEVEIVLSATGQCHFENGNEADAEKSDGPPEKEQRILVKAPWFPRCLAEGDQVYARGKFAVDRPDFFEAEDVFPCRGRGGLDPTGVRSRFHHHRREMMRKMGEALHD